MHDRWDKPPLPLQWHLECCLPLLGFLWGAARVGWSFLRLSLILSRLPFNLNLAMLQEWDKVTLKCSSMYLSDMRINWSFSRELSSTRSRTDGLYAMSRMLQISTRKANIVAAWKFILSSSVSWPEFTTRPAESCKLHSWYLNCYPCPISLCL